MKYSYNFLLQVFFLIIGFTTIATANSAQNQVKQNTENIAPNLSDTMIANTHCRQGMKYWREQYFQDCAFTLRKAIEVYEKIIPFSKDSLTWNNYVESLYFSGYSYTIIGDTDIGLTYLNKSAELILDRFGGNHRLISFAYTKLGHTFRAMNQMAKAEEFIEKAFRIRMEKMNIDEFYHCAGYMNMGHTKMAAGKYKEALKYFDNALRLLKTYHSNNHVEIAFISLAISECYSALGQEELGVKYSLAANNIIQKKVRKDHPIVAHALGKMSTHSQSIGEIDKAISLQKKRIDIQKINVGPKSPIVTLSYIKLSQLYLEENEHDNALSIIDSALSIALQSTTVDKLVATQDSEESFDECYCPCLTAMHNKADILINKHDSISKKSEDLILALNYYEAMIDRIESIRHNLIYDKEKEKACKNNRNLFEAAIDLSLKIYDLSKDKHYLDVAYSFMERSKAILLFEARRKMIQAKLEKLPASNQEADLEFKKLVFELKESIKKRENEKDINETELDQLKDSLFSLNAEYEDFLKKIDITFEGINSQYTSDELANVNAIQQKLSNNNSLYISYFMGEEHLYAFYISPSSVQFKSINLDSTLINDIEIIKNFVNTPPNVNKTTPIDYSSFIVQSSNLYQVLIGDHLGPNVKELIVSPDGILNFLPFQILIKNTPNVEDNYRNLPYLIKSCNIRYAYSGNLFLEEKMSDIQYEKEFCAFAPSYDSNRNFQASREDSFIINLMYPNVRSSFSPLKYNIPEVEEIGRLFGKNIFTQEQATESSFKAMATNTKIIHLAMHGNTNDLNPMYSWLVFNSENDQTEDGFLHAYEIYNTPLNSDLIVLSACSTGDGKLNKGEGVMSLARAFMYAGVDNVIMSRWQVDDKSTKDLMVSLYKNFDEGIPKAEALRVAQLEFLETTEERYSHPYYWAAFALIGDNYPVSESKNYLAFIFIIMGLLTSLFLIKRLKA